mmetsp:Transcript_40339/g.81294  ORF Transcript_40339/g.81294 Transcript_40339/m.81294 type:complete len:134 (+) Transcript_40339:98-499(+)
MNPKADAVVPERSSLLVLADDSSISILRRPNFASRRSWSPSYQTMRAALSETPRHVLVLNFDPDTDPLEEIDESLPEGSTVAVLSPDKVLLLKPKHVKTALGRRPFLPGGHVPLKKELEEGAREGKGGGGSAA